MSKKTFVLVQLSDPHIGADWGGKDPSSGLAAAVDAVRALPAKADAVLVSGDLSEHGSEQEYEEVRKLLSRLEVGLVVVAGNHDDRDNLRRFFDLPGSAEEPLRYSVDLGPIRLVVMDTTIPGRDSGELEPAQLDWLDAELAVAPGIATIIAMHHPPLPTGVPAWDVTALPLPQRRALGDVVDRHGQVRTLVGGHVHRAITSRLSGRPVVTAPSTYVQARLTLGSDRVEFSDDEPSAFVVHTLVDDEVVSHLQPIVGRR